MASESAEYAEGFSLGRGAAAWSKDKIGCPGSTIEAFAREDVAKAVASITTQLVGELQREGKLTSPDQVRGFSEGLFRQLVALCTGSSSPTPAEQAPAPIPQPLLKSKPCGGCSLPGRGDNPGNGKCSKCAGYGVSSCVRCGGNGICPGCQGSGWV